MTTATETVNEVSPVWGNTPHPTGVPANPIPEPEFDSNSQGGTPTEPGTGVCADTFHTVEDRLAADPGLGPVAAREGAAAYVASLDTAPSSPT